MPSSSRESLRLFYALWPDATTRTALLQLQSSMRGRKSPYENLHITLAFLGSQPPALLPVLKDILAHLPAAAMTLTLDQIGYFNRNRIAWIGMHMMPPPLIALQRNLEQALARHDVVFDHAARFKPHITLVRDALLPPDIVFTPITWHANQVTLVQSVTRPEGSTYTILASRSLEEEVLGQDERGPRTVMD
jgi:RNA 2',3'-cyclic 3'-phosphodiesterase